MKLYNIKYLPQCPALIDLRKKFKNSLTSRGNYDYTKNHDLLFLASLEIALLHNFDIPLVKPFADLISKDNSKEVIAVNKKHINHLEKEFIFSLSKSVLYQNHEKLEILVNQLIELTPKNEIPSTNLQKIAHLIPQTKFFNTFINSVIDYEPEVSNYKHLNLAIQISLEYFLLNKDLQKFRNKEISQLKNQFTTLGIIKEIKKHEKELDSKIELKYLSTIIQTIISETLMSELDSELYSLFLNEKLSNKEVKIKRNKI